MWHVCMCACVYVFMCICEIAGAGLVCFFVHTCTCSSRSRARTHAQGRESGTVRSAHTSDLDWMRECTLACKSALQGTVVMPRTAHLLLLSLCLQIAPTLGHARLECPPSRSKKNGAKEGPCDAQDVAGIPAYSLQPGLNTVTWLESIGHPGAAGHFVLSLDDLDEGFEDCILLDHVPHNEPLRPQYGREETYQRSAITLFIPKVQRSRCHLQFLSYI